MTGRKTIIALGLVFMTGLQGLTGCGSPSFCIQRTDGRGAAGDEEAGLREQHGAFLCGEFLRGLL